MNSPSAGRPLVSLLCLSFGRPEYLKESLAAMEAQTYPNTEIWVVDNRSNHSDDIAQLVAAQPKARLLSIFRNRGYTGGMNTGLDNVTGDYVLLTEDDTVADPDCVERLVEHFEKHPETGLASGLILNRTSGTIRSAGAVLRLAPSWEKRILEAGEPDNGKLMVPYFVNSVPGACLFMRSNFLRQLRGFRRDFFAYCEDDELCLRIARIGKPIVVVPRARIAHFEPSSGPDSPVVRFHKQKNFLALYLLHAPLGVALAAMWRYGAQTLYRVWRSGEDVWVCLQARLWILGNLPRLLLDRLQLRVDCRPDTEGESK